MILRQGGGGEWKFRKKTREQERHRGSEIEREKKKGDGDPATNLTLFNKKDHSPKVGGGAAVPHLSKS